MKSVFLIESEEEQKMSHETIFCFIEFGTECHYLPFSIRFQIFLRTYKCNVCD